MDDADARRRSHLGRLPFRMGLALCAGTAVILVGAGAWNLHLQRAHLTRLVGLSADRIAETIRTSTRDAMLRNDREALHRTIGNLGSQQGIVRIRIFDKRGTIRTSTRPTEVGRLLDVRAEQCTACHLQDRPLERLERADRIRTFGGADGGRVLGIIAPIHNEPQCTTACHAHPPSQRLLGVLDVQLSMDAVDEALAASEGQMLTGLAVTGAAVLLLAGALLWRMVLRPVARLTAAMSHVANGDLAVQVPVTSSDEIGLMAASWNTMTAELARARGELTEWNRTLEDRVRGKTEELERAHRQMIVVEKMASLGKLAAVVAHEINNPLAGIRTYARLLRRRLRSAVPVAGGSDPTAAPSPLPADPEVDRILETVDAEAGRCGDIVRNLLVFSRTSPARFAEEDLAPILERCGFLLRHQAELQGVRLATEVAAGVRIVCDAAQVQQLLLALALNALEATPAGGRVLLAARIEDDGAVVTVSDTGCGIPPEHLPRIFEPFFTTREQGKGVGLGLAVAYGIVARHGGTIALDSRVGEGTVFTIRFPRRPPGEEAAPGTPAERSDERG